MIKPLNMQNKMVFYDSTIEKLQLLLQESSPTARFYRRLI